MKTSTGSGSWTWISGARVKERCAVAVTGGAGYIGSVVAEVLLREGHQVLVLDNLVKGHRTAVPVDAEFLDVSIDNRPMVASSLRDFGCDAVIHMAAYSLVGESVVDPGKYFTNNVAAGLLLLEAMREARVARLVFSSTAAVYGEPAKQPVEESDPTEPTNPYGETKLAFERALRWYASAYGLSSTSLRYFTSMPLVRPRSAASSTILKPTSFRSCSRSPRDVDHTSVCSATTIRHPTAHAFATTFTRTISHALMSSRYGE